MVLCRLVLSPYGNLRAKCRRIDARKLSYRFDLERDVCWDRMAEPGHHFSNPILRDFGFDGDLCVAHPDAGEFVEVALALAVSEIFIVLEELICEFVRSEQAFFEESQSSAWLVEEEIKHIELFGRYRSQLRGRLADGGAAFDAALVPTRQAFLSILHSFPGTADSAAPAPASSSELLPAARHYLFWCNAIFFEEITVYLHDRLEASDVTVQPTWLAVHRVHRQEEVQHLVTDEHHLDALELPDEMRAMLQKMFALSVVKNYPHFFATAVVDKVFRATFPALGPIVVPGRVAERGVYGDILRAPQFRRTRRVAPDLLQPRLR
jgi:hypothetical protein